MSGFVFIFAPDVAQRLLKSLGVTLGVVLFLFLGFDDLIHATSGVALTLVGAAVSTLAYFIRERRLGRPAHRDAPRHAERTPVMPQYIPDEDRE